MSDLDPTLEIVKGCEEAGIPHGLTDKEIEDAKQRSSVKNNRGKKR